ncbi:hypothetical protein CBER1_01765 [Cercospora berteroae]|uniref:Uncharacterized protein n=1 Tax=Cercospora berteroae TaxID=357750 RepID=A0A2S6CA92_9PEZI|nr:hypothetical protein CBER1_01765 [Cercospora berteroae]
MLFSTSLLAATLTTLASSAALPVHPASPPDPAYSLRCLDKPNLDCNAPTPSPLTTPLPGTFNITNFIFGCTSGCYWYLDLSIEINPGSTSTPEHPGFTNPVHIQGGLDENKSYVVNATAGENQSVGAYIEKESGILQLEYVVNVPDQWNPNGGATYNYTAAVQVYAATSHQADLQEPNFRVAEQQATGIA